MNPQTNYYVLSISKLPYLQKKIPNYLSKSTNHKKEGEN